jgi:hypothetical protein
MKVVSMTSTRLAIRHKPVVKWLVGASMLISGLASFGYLMFTPKMATLTCTRVQQEQVSCQLRQVAVLGFVKRQYIGNISSAVVVDRGKSGKILKVYSDAGIFSLMPFFKANNDEEASLEINNFLNNTQQPLISVSQEAHVVDILIVVLLLGIIIYLGCDFSLTKEVLCNFDKSLNNIVIKKRGFRNVEICEYPLDQILLVYADKRMEKIGNSERIILRFKSGIYIVLNEDYIMTPSIKETVHSIQFFIDN